MAAVGRATRRSGAGRGVAALQQVRERPPPFGDDSPPPSRQQGSRRPGESASRRREALTLAELEGVGDRGYRLAVDHFGSPEAALSAGRGLKAIVPTAHWGRNAMLSARNRADSKLRDAAMRGVSLLTYGGRGYPERLHRLHDPPRALWLVGRARILDLPHACAVVGTRRASAYGSRAARALGMALARRGVVVVSGMAMGIDGEAHTGALRAGGPTVAVLGSGVDVPTPRTQSGLYRQIREHGVVVSEFAPGQGAAPHNFPRRNRIIAALSEALVVVEAAQRSGSLITVDHAVDVGVHVHAVPGPIDSGRSAGSNALLADGAGVVTSAESFADQWGEPRGGEHVPGPAGPVTDRERLLWNSLADGPMTVDALVAAVRWPASEVLATLGSLELQGWIEPVPGGRFARTPGR